MRGGAFVAAAVAALTATTGAACPINQSGLPERMADLSAERGVLTPEASAALARMRMTAEELDRLGFGPQCEEVLDTALAMIEGEAAWREPVSGDAIGATVGSLNLSALSSAETRATALVGRPVLTTGNTAVGVVEDVLFDPAGSASHLLVRRGGWEDERERLAMPVGRMLGEPSGRLYVEISVDGIAGAPGWTEGADMAANDEWYAGQAGLIVEQRAMEARKARTAERARAEIGMAGTPETPEAPPPAVVEPEPRLERTASQDGPKRIRVEKDRPESAEGSSD